MSKQVIPERFVICFTNQAKQAVVHRAASRCFADFPDFDARTTLWTQPKANGQLVFDFGAAILGSDKPEVIDWCSLCCGSEKKGG